MKILTQDIKRATIKAVKRYLQKHLGIQLLTVDEYEELWREHYNLKHNAKEHTTEIEWLRRKCEKLDDRIADLRLFGIF